MACNGILVDEVSSQSTLTSFYFWRGSDQHGSQTTFQYTNTEYSRMLRNAQPRTLASELSASGITTQDLRDLALTLTCGKDWDGCPVSDIQRHIADYAHCLLLEGLWWSLSLMGSIKKRRGADLSQKSQAGILTVADIERLSSGGHADRLLGCFASVGKRRSYFVTNRGHSGLRPDAMVDGDQLCSLHGAMVPFILRKRTDGTYQLVSECYVLEMMQGELQKSLIQKSRGKMGTPNTKFEIV